MSIFILYCDVLIFKASITNYHKLGCLKQHKPILSQFKAPEMQNQGVAGLVPNGKL